MKLTLIIFLKYALIELFILFWIRLRIIGYIVKQKHLKTKYYKTSFKDYNIVRVTEFLLINNNVKLAKIFQIILLIIHFFLYLFISFLK